VDFEKESDLENAILEVEKQLFGKGRIYLDVKKKIGLKGSTQNIPDGYLLDLNGQKPRLFVVENELASHDPLRHIAVQILQFSLSFEEYPHKVKGILIEALRAQLEAQSACERYAKEKGFRNLDHLLEHLVHDVPFAALVIIDVASDDLENVLAKKFNFPVEVLELATFRNSSGERVYYFEPFLEGVSDGSENSDQPFPGQQRPDISQIDTVVVPAREEGFERVFLGEDRWYISEKAKEINHLKLVKGGHVRPLQGLRYTTKTILDSANTLDDVW
jgi:hypothetical protein